MPHPFIEDLLNLLFPDRCAGCGRVGALFCTACRAALVPYGAARQRLSPDLAGVQIAYVFGGPLRAAVHQLKYRRRRRVAHPLGMLLAAHLDAHPFCQAPCAIVPVPLHPDRFHERGFNQAEGIARAVATSTGLPLLVDGLVRLRDTGHQARLSADERRVNMDAAFAWVGADVPRSAIIIDDVLTTGATIGVCATVVMRAGAGAVYGLALARSRLR